MNFLSAVVLIGLLILIHEFGHFVVARACGVHVEVFSIGFGRRIFGWTHKGTDYRIALLPFGGYVRMKGSDVFGDRPEDYAPEDDDDAFLRRPVWQRLLIVAAGPVFNLLLPVVVFTLVFLVGEPQPAAMVGTVLPETAAEQVGIEPGDRIRGVWVNGTLATTETLVELYDVLEELPPRPPALRLQLEGFGGARAVDLPLNEWDAEGVPSLSATGLLATMASAEIGVDDPMSPAGRAGLQIGDVVTAVNEIPVKSWPQVRAALNASSGPHIIAYLREGEPKVVTVEAAEPTQVDGFDGSGEARFETEGADWGLAPASLFVAEISEGSPADLAGVQPGDHLLSIDRIEVTSWAQVLRIVGGSADESGVARALELVLGRAGERIALTITPELIEETDAIGRPRTRPIIGVSRDGDVIEPDPILRRYGLVPAFARAVDRTVWLTGATAAQIGRIITGEVSAKESLGGPVEIVRQAKKAAEEGIYRWASLMGMLSISLGLINLLPVPVLDGGQLLFYSIEAIRGRPVSVRVREMAQQVGVLLLMALMLFVLVVDVNRWLGAL